VDGCQCHESPEEPGEPVSTEGSSKSAEITPEESIISANASGVGLYYTTTGCATIADRCAAIISAFLGGIITITHVYIVLAFIALPINVRAETAFDGTHFFACQFFHNNSF
jgi:hypothetical protein